MANSQGREETTADFLADIRGAHDSEVDHNAAMCTESGASITTSNTTSLVAVWRELCFEKMFRRRQREPRPNSNMHAHIPPWILSAPVTQRFKQVTERNHHFVLPIRRQVRRQILH